MILEGLFAQAETGLQLVHKAVQVGPADLLKVCAGTELIGKAAKGQFIVTLRVFAEITASAEPKAVNRGVESHVVSPWEPWDLSRAPDDNK